MPWWHVHRRIYDWTLAWAYRPSAAVALFLLSLAESSFFPVPPDVLLMPLVLGNRRKWFRYAFLCSLASVIGGVLGYCIGWGAWQAVDWIFFDYVPGFTPEVFATVRRQYERYNFWVVFTAGFTPIPFKVITITAGVFGTGEKVSSPYLFFGVFLVASVEVFRVDPSRDADKTSSGTGGFGLYGESAVPILYDLNDPARRGKLALAGPDVQGADVVQFKVHEGDDASCLNLNRAQQPRLLGVVPGRLKGRFTFIETLDDAGDKDPWTLLARDAGAGTVPAIGDNDTLRWALHKDLGDTIEITDERGRVVTLRLVGRITGSIFQGNLLISEEHFRRLFPSASGYRAFLIDLPASKAQAASKAFSAALEDFGLELTPAARRLARFAEVQNTYLSIFTALGGLGLLLGSVALGVVVLRNVLERRGELALLRAVGFARRQLQWMVLCEHWALLALGLFCGVASAVVAVLPALRSSAGKVPYAPWLLTLGGIIVSGVVWTYLAAAAALRGELLEALRRE